MAYDQTTLETQLTAVMAAITSAIASPAANWSVGSVKFNQTEYMAMLFAQRDALIKQIRSIPSESIDTVQNGVGTLGTDSAEYLGEDQ
jgi:hypothetical protein